MTARSALLTTLLLLFASSSHSDSTASAEPTARQYINQHYLSYIFSPQRQAVLKQLITNAREQYDELPIESRGEGTELSTTQLSSLVSAAYKKTFPGSGTLSLYQAALAVEETDKADQWYTSRGYILPGIYADSHSSPSLDQLLSAAITVCPRPAKGNEIRYAVQIACILMEVQEQLLRNEALKAFGMDVLGDSAYEKDHSPQLWDQILSSLSSALGQLDTSGEFFLSQWNNPLTNQKTFNQALLRRFLHEGSCDASSCNQPTSQGDASYLPYYLGGYALTSVAFYSAGSLLLCSSSSLAIVLGTSLLITTAAVNFASIFVFAFYIGPIYYGTTYN